MAEARLVLASIVLGRPADDGEPGSRPGGRHVFVARKSGQPAAISAHHTCSMTVTAPTRKENIFNEYGDFSRNRSDISPLLEETVARSETASTGKAGL